MHLKPSSIAMKHLNSFSASSCRLDPETFTSRVNGNGGERCLTYMSLCFQKPIEYDLHYFHLHDTVHDSAWGCEWARPIRENSCQDQRDQSEEGFIDFQ